MLEESHVHSISYRDLSLSGSENRNAAREKWVESAEIWMRAWGKWSDIVKVGTVHKSFEVAVEQRIADFKRPKLSRLIESFRCPPLEWGADHLAVNSSLGELCVPDRRVDDRPEARENCTKWGLLNISSVWEIDGVFAELTCHVLVQPQSTWLGSMVIGAPPSNLTSFPPQKYLALTVSIAPLPLDSDDGASAGSVQTQAAPMHCGSQLSFSAFSARIGGEAVSMVRLKDGSAAYRDVLGSEWSGNRTEEGRVRILISKMVSTGQSGEFAFNQKKEANESEVKDDNSNAELEILALNLDDGVSLADMVSCAASSNGDFGGRIVRRGQPSEIAVEQRFARALSVFEDNEGESYLVLSEARESVRRTVSSSCTTERGKSMSMSIRAATRGTGPSSEAEAPVTSPSLMD